MTKPESENEKTVTEKEDEAVARPADRALNLAEDVVYILAGLLLLGGAVAVLVAVGFHLAKDIGKGVEGAITSALDGLLLVFILLELLAAVRATMTERKLVAEPFLVAGIIASIKEIIVVSLGAKESMGKEGPAFDDAMMQIGILGGIVLLLALASWLVRRKEREPEEESEATD
ncbi:MAG TPA: phosphate-starvation-inducible PsiE family protein [Acidimicrobiales bacterium]|nr:phosphate-starvation-inducible PsiE family protein [Acidimicrobiales bacterium]